MYARDAEAIDVRDAEAFDVCDPEDIDVRSVEGARVSIEVLLRRACLYRLLLMYVRYCLLSSQPCQYVIHLQHHDTSSPS